MPISAAVEHHQRIAAFDFLAQPGVDLADDAQGPRAHLDLLGPELAWICPTTDTPVAMWSTRTSSSLIFATRKFGFVERDRGQLPGGSFGRLAVVGPAPAIVQDRRLRAGARPACQADGRRPDSSVTIARQRPIPTQGRAALIDPLPEAALAQCNRHGECSHHTRRLANERSFDREEDARAPVSADRLEASPARRSVPA